MDRFSMLIFFFFFFFLNFVFYISDTNEKTFAQRTLKKLNSVYTVAVEDIGFREIDVENAMRVTGGFPLSVVLDWVGRQYRRESKLLDIFY